MQQREYQNHMLKVINSIQKKGPLNSFPFGMSNYVLFNGKPNPEYTGSYHITMTMPYTSKTTSKKFRDMHINFANQMQWLEPLLLTAFFSPFPIRLFAVLFG